MRAGGEGLAPQGMPVQDPNDRSLYPTQVASASSCGDGHSANAGLKNQVMTGGDIVAPPGGQTVWRRRRHWPLFIHHQPIRSQPTDAAMTQQPSTREGFPREA